MSAGSAFDQENSPLYEALRKWRTVEARAANLPPYCILSDRTLATIAEHTPATIDELSQLNGMGPVKIEKFGGAILAVVNEHADDQPQ